MRWADVYVSGLGPTTVLHDGVNPTQEATGAVVRNLLMGLGVDDSLSYASDSGETRCSVSDALGSTIALTDASGAVVTEYTSEAFGSTTATGGPSENRAQFTGRENDGTGLYYYRARYYHPGLQRFISEDPIGLSGRGNLYAYVANAPTRFTDPQGLHPLQNPRGGLIPHRHGPDGTVEGDINCDGFGNCPPKHRELTPEEREA